MSAKLIKKQLVHKFVNHKFVNKLSFYTNLTLERLNSTLLLNVTRASITILRKGFS